ncbi:MAG: dTDP-4-dehydrorhamnose reductase [Chitinophagaceae bacterium]|nr:dTDP-4-dehydrorhamnose reductase [Chitinophagaceae bacterium]
MKDNKPAILVTGANGQLGKELQVLAKTAQQFNFIFTAKEQLPIQDEQALFTFFNDNKIDFCINCAAYTAVDKAESEKENAFLINAMSVGSLAKICFEFKAKFIHISTDYVFDGMAGIPYLENSITNPLSVYGESKLSGEVLALKNNPDTIIIRTSWVFSSFGNNFVKTMLRLMKEKESINVVSDQQGCPTYAADLAQAILKIVTDYPSSITANAIYNFCNEGVTTWYQFAIAIKEMINSSCAIHPITTAQYPTAARRPQYSILDTSKIKNTFHLDIPHWKESLAKCIELIATDK